MSHALCASLGFAHVSVDEVRTSLSDPALHTLGGRPEVWDAPVGELCGNLVAAGDALSPHLRSLIDVAMQTGTSTVIEGEGIHPAFIEARSSERVRGLMLIEPSADQHYQVLLDRAQSFTTLSEKRRRKVAQMNAAYSQWLEREGQRHGVRCILSRPWPSAFARVVAALEPAGSPS